MTKEKWLEIIKLIASFAVGVATIVLAQSCISSWNINKNSAGAKIKSEQSAKSKIEQLKQDGAKRGDVLEKQKELEQAITDAANAKITALEKKHNEELESIKIEGVS